ncbi:MAG: DegT/DnrJ/EryC1/StrS family aminotransferase, partial [Bacteroidia bacterium]|nr:DegT/DnrJ/EryC1/StrS family aminotransferase [Bacteroidia bacterium]
MNDFIVPFNNFDYQDSLYKDLILKKIESIINSKYYVLGENTLRLEEEYSQLNDVKFTIGVSSGLDALIIALRSLEISSGDEIIVPSNTYIATWLAISSVGA